MKTILFLLLSIFIVSITVQAQINVGSNAAPDSSAMLQISGTAKGFLPPRMTKDSMYLIRKPARGLIVFNTSDSLLYMHRDSGWVALAASGVNAWLTNGNSGTSSGTNFLGTTDFASLRFRSNNIERMVIDSLGRVGIGTTTPAQKLDVTGSINASANVLAQASAVVDVSGLNNGTLTPGLQFGSTGSGEAISSKRSSGGNQAGLDFYTNSTNRMTITNAGNVGIGTTSPATALHVSATTNPLTLSGVQSGATTDSLLTITSAGLVRRLNISTFATPGNTISSLNGLTATSQTFAVPGTAGTAPAWSSTGSVHNLNIPLASATGVTAGLLSNADWTTFNNKASTTNSWSTTGNAGTNSGANFLGTTDLTSLRFRSNNTERMVVDSLGRIGMGVTNPTARVVLKDSLEIRRVGSLSQLLFTNTASSGDFRIGGDGGDIFWQGGGGRSLQMGSFHTTILAGDRQNSTFPAFIGSTYDGTGVLVLGQRDASVPLAVQANSASQTANLTNWRNASGTVLTSISKDGYLGIGTSTPATALHVSATTNPLTLTGVQSGATTDSLLTITSAGLVRRINTSTFASPTNSWSTTGNAGISYKTSFLGTTDSASVRFRTSNTQRLLLDSLGNVAIGSNPSFSASPSQEKLLVDAGNTNSINVISGKGNINNYLQLNIQNNNAGTAASSDVVATADNGNETTNFVDLGINSSANTANFFGAANDAYLYAQSQNMLIGTASASKNVVFLTGGGTQSTNERMRIDGNGNVGIGTNAPSNKLQVSSTANPLSLLGVQTGTNTDSLLTITGGVVRKLPASSISGSSSNAWSLTGNTNTLASNYFLGTTNADPLVMKVNSQQTGYLDGANTFLGFLAGSNNGTTATQSTGIGYHALFSNTSGTYNTAIGYGALPNNATGSNNIGIGNNANVANNSSNSIAVGTNSVVNYSNSIAVGTGAQANNTGAVGIGNNTYVNGLYGIAIGSGPNSPITQAFGNYSIGLGYNAYAGTTNSIAIGTGTTSNGSNGVALGNTASSASANSTAIGASASVTGANSTAIGYNAAAATDNAVVLGDKSNANTSIAIGSENFSNGNREKLLVDAGATNSVNVISGKGSINNYLQLNIQNKSTGTSASSDVVATADNGDETTNYVDMGINSSTNNANFFGAANDAYLYSLGQNMLIGTAAAGKNLAFLTGGGTQSTNERMRIDGTGNVGIGTTSPTAVLQLKAGTATAGTAPLKLTSGNNLTTPENGAVEYDGTNYYATSGSTRYTLAKTLTATATLDFPSTAAASSSTLTVTVTGAADGDAVTLGVPNAANNDNSNFTAYVSAANTVTVKFNNYSAAAIDPASGTFRVSVLRY